MVSVKRFFLDEPILLKAIQSFVFRFSSVKDPIVGECSKAKNLNEKIAWTILGSALYQDLDMKEIVLLIRNLMREFPKDKMWAIPVPKEFSIDAVVRETLKEKKWTLQKNAAGIFWSVGFFIRKHQNLILWLNNSSTQEIWRNLGEIYFMGKRGVRTKVCATIYRLCSDTPIGLGLLLKSKSKKQIPMPLSMGARRFLSIMGPAKEEGFANLEPEKKQKLMNEFCNAVCPESPYKVSHALQFYLETLNGQFLCKKIQNKCEKCALFSFCNYGRI